MSNNSSTYTQKTKLRELVFPAYFEGKISRDSAIARLNISPRQFCRLQKRYLVDKDLRHKLCNVPSNHSFDPVTKKTVLEYCKTKYHGWNYEHIHDSLLWRDNILVSSDTIRTWLLAAKLSLPKQRRQRKYMRREPKAKFGEMLQLDGTFGDFLGDGRMLCLMHLVDDATKTSLAMLFEAECTESAMQLLYQWCLKYGIPQSIYCDRHGTYKVNEKKLTLEEEVEGVEIRLSEFGKVCERLGIQQIFARSPQAKGRVERKHYLYKDRCVKEFKLDGIKTIDDANTYLALHNGFVSRLNDKFTIEAREARTACVLPTPADLAGQFTIQNIRTVRNDYTVQLNTIVYQLPRNSVVNARAKVVMKQYLDGSIGIFAGNVKLAHTIIESYVKPVQPIKNTSKVTQQSAMRYVSPKDHPFRKNYKPEKLHRYPSGSKQLQELGSLYGG